ncbi:MAG: hypothetical protein WBN83_03330 [Desulfoprunum sp.]|uniref:hypothetical protein n=1 Tax=Desulfoprunum sp. TaxID=2020866 RepID=UPI003C723DAB
MCSWQQLHRLLLDAPPHAESILCRSCRSPLPDGKTWQRLLAATPLGLRGLLHRHLLSSLAGNPAQDVCEPEYLEIFSAVTPEITISSLSGSNWLVMPLLTTRGGSGGRVVHVLAGLVPGEDSLQVAANFSPTSLEALQIAYTAYSSLHLLPGRTLVLVPLMREDSPPISGCSLALPIALALYLLDRRLSWPDGVFATGGLQPDGKVVAVDGVPEKCRIARFDGGHSMFVVPSNCPEVTDPVVPIPCTSLDQALNDLEYLLIDNNPEVLVEFRPFLARERLLLSRLHELPLPLLHHPDCRSSLRNIGAHPGDFLHYAVKALQHCSFDPARADWLADLYSIETLQELIDHEEIDAVQTVYEWCINRIAFANHIGDTCSVGRWKEFQQTLETRVTADQHLTAWNHLFVAERFNRYHFSMAIPDDIQRLLSEEEARNRIAHRPNKRLGAMYGTLSQNCGFCGPQWFAGLEEYAVKAETSFDREYDSEKRRLSLYRVYGHLDREDYSQAGQWLNHYLGLQPGDGPERWLEQAVHLAGGKQEVRLFSLALIVRALADMKITPDTKDILALTAELGQRIPRHLQHPWQLILLNLARLLGEAGLVAECRTALQRAAAICLAGGETMQAMALQVYAELQYRSLIDEPDLLAAEEVRQRVLTSGYLHSQHFSGLRENTETVRMLEHLHRNRSTFFPFSYR